MTPVPPLSSTAAPRPTSFPAPDPGSAPAAWYREPWPWLLFGIPAATALAGIVTIALAAVSFDGVVADDYYREGLAINRTLARDAQARAQGLQASVQFNPEGSRVRVTLSPRPAVESAVWLRVIHPSRAGVDQRVALAETAPGLYEGALERPPEAGRWRLVIEDAGERWRLAGATTLPAGEPLELRAPAPSEGGTP